MLLEEILPKIKAGSRQGETMNLDDIMSALGEPDYIMIKAATDQLVGQVDETIEYLKTTSVKMTKTLKEMFPGRGIVGLPMPEDGEQKATHAGGNTEGTLRVDP